MMQKSSAVIQLTGYVPANRDAVVKLTNEATGGVIERKPFLDGTLQVRDLDPGMYEIEVRHPNLTLPIDRRKIRIFPQPTPTVVPIPVPADLFIDTPIRDIPDADLGPVQQTITAARARLQPITGKGPGEAIRAADWNTLASTVFDLSSAMLELTNLIAPLGHDHAEIAEKIGQVQENVRRFAEAYGRSLLDLRREIESLSLRRSITDLFDAGGVAVTEDLKKRITDKVNDLQSKTQAETPVFTQRLSTTGSAILTAINEIAVAKGAEGDAFLAQVAVKELATVARQYTEAGTQSNPESELMTYQRTTTASGGQKMARLVK